MQKAHAHMAPCTVKQNTLDCSWSAAGTPAGPDTPVAPTQNAPQSHAFF